MSLPALLGVDVDTSSTKGVLVGMDGYIIATASRTHQVDRPAPRQVEMDGRLWWDEFVAITRELSTVDTDIVAVGVSGMGPSALLLDDDDEPVRPAILYGVDTRSQSQITQLDARYGTDNILTRCGSKLTSQALGPKLAWVHENEPELWQRARRVFMPSSLLVRKLTGAYVLDHHSASQCTPLYDPKTQSWIPKWADEIAPGLDLPRLRWPGEIAGEVTADIAGVRRGTPVITGTIDAWTESVSVGAIEPGDLMLMYGTTMFLIATVEAPLRHPAMWGTVGAFPQTHNLAGGLATSGAITDWLRRLVGDVDYPTLLGEAAASPAGAPGLLMLPYFAGERTPIQDPNARGTIAGLTLSHTRSDIYRAALEGTAFAVRHNVDTMRSAGATLQRVVAVGGGTQGHLWTQIVSDRPGSSNPLPDNRRQRCWSNHCDLEPSPAPHNPGARTDPTNCTNACSPSTGTSTTRLQTSLTGS